MRADLLAEAEIGNFAGVVLNKNICRFDVSVNYAF